MNTTISMSRAEVYENRRMFGKAVARYLWQIKTVSPVVNRTHHDYKALCDLFGHHRVEQALEAHWNRYTHRVLGHEPTLFCENWDSQYSHDAYPIIEIGEGITSVGALQSVDYEAVEAAAGIQHWSKPF